MESNKGKTVHMEGQTGFYKGKKFPIQKEEFVIGRSSDCDLIMKEKTISARHAKISRIQDGYEIEDLDSTNSTFVNGFKVNKKKLRTADSIKLDVFEFTFINPFDVPRTELSPSLKTEPSKETVNRSPKEEPEIHISATSEKTQPLLDGSRKKGTKTARSGNLLNGLSLGLLIAFLLSYGGTLLGIMIQNQATAFNTASLFKSELVLFPLRYLHTTWLNVDNWSLAIGISLLSLVLGPFIGALITQDLGRKKPLFTAALFSLSYFMVIALVQIIILKFNLSAWVNTALGSGLGIISRMANFIAVMAYFWMVCLIFSIIGTLSGKKR